MGGVSKFVLLCSLFLLLIFSGAACGKPVKVLPPQPGFTDGTLLATEQAAWLAGHWRGQSERDKSFSLKIAADSNTFDEEVQYQVGAKDDAVVPYPTVCHYRMLGLVKVTSSSQADKDHYKKFEKKNTPELNLNMWVQKFELIEDESNSPPCVKFIARENQGESKQYTMNITKLGAASIVDAWSDITYQKAL